MNWHEWFGKKDEPWWHLATRGPIELVDRDTGEIVEIKPGQDTPGDIEGLLIDFRYVDANGAASRRALLCWQCWRDDGHIYVRGYCPWREDFRTFRVDRMQDLIEIRTGRQIPISDTEAYFDTFADDIESGESQRTNFDFKLDISDVPLRVTTTWEPPSRAHMEARATMEHIRHRARRDCIAGLLIITDIVLADDLRDNAEREIETTYIQARLAMADYRQGSWLADEMASIVRALAVPPGSFTAAIREVAKDEAYFNLVRVCADGLAKLEGGNRKAKLAAFERLLSAGREAGWI